MTQITAEALRRELAYDPETGVFTRLIARGGQKVGAVAGWQGKNGYWYINVCGRKHSAHRLAWLHFYGVWPSTLLDHRNRRQMDNRISNLREATDSLNSLNTPLRRDNTSGHRGVYWFPRTQKWMAMVCVNGRQVHLGYFVDKQDAIAARHAAMVGRGDADVGGVPGVP
jgi:hypothetical protein